MRKKEVEELRAKLDLLKCNIINSIRDSNDSISVLNSISTSEEADISSFKSIAHIDENTLRNNSRDLEDIKRAIQKIETNQYGKCEMCGEQINIKRLRTKPYARFCITCREIYEKQNSAKQTKG